MKENFFENEYVEYWLENGVIIKSYKMSVRRIDIEIAKTSAEGLQHMLRLCNQRMPLLVETNKAIYIDREAGKLVNTHSNYDGLKAVGVVMNNPAAMLGGKLYVAINKPKVRMNFFTNRTKAIEWLNSYKDRF